MADNALAWLIGQPAQQQEQENPLRALAYRNSPRESYISPMTPAERDAFTAWVRQNNVPYDPSPKADYDMPGFWLALKNGDPRAKSAISPDDNRMHFPDTWKTPYHQTFSNESQYSTNPYDPKWVRNGKFFDLVQGGQVLKRERAE